MQNKSGFTLMELMAVIAIISIMTAISLPPLMRWRADHQLVSAANQVYSDLQNAKIRALKEDGTIIVAFTVADNSYFVYIDKNLNNTYEAAKDRLLWTGTLPPGVKFSSVSFSGLSQVGFNAVGIASSSGSIILIGSNKNLQKINVNLTGNTQMVN